MAQSRRIRSIEIMRIIAALGVFTGHYLGKEIASEYSMNLLKYMRNSYIGKSVLSYLFEGDISVIFFFVVSGFLITYNYYSYGYNNAKIQKDVIRKIFGILLPSIAIIFITAFTIYVCDNFNVGDNFSFLELKKDIIKIVFFWERGDAIPYYAYQLWYIPRMVLGYICIYAFLGLTSEHKRSRMILYILIIMYLFVHYFSLSLVFLGAFAGELCTLCDAKKIIKKCNKAVAVLIMISALIAGPFVYNEHNLGIINQFIMGGCMALVIFISVLLHYSEIQNGHNTNKIYLCIDWLDDINFAFYLVHVFSLQFVQIIYNLILEVWRWSGGILLWVMYLFSVLFTIIVAKIYKETIMKYMSMLLEHGLKKLGI